MYFRLLFHGSALDHRSFFFHLEFCNLASLSASQLPYGQPILYLASKVVFLKTQTTSHYFPLKTSQRLPTALRIKSKLLRMTAFLLSSLPGVLTYIALQNQSHTSTCLCHCCDSLGILQGSVQRRFLPTPPPRLELLTPLGLPITTAPPLYYDDIYVRAP